MMIPATFIVDWLDYDWNLNVKKYRPLILWPFVVIAGLLPVKGSAEPLPKADKAAHFAVSSLGVATALKFFQWLHPEKKVTPTARFLSSSLLLAIGAAKEVDDAERYNTIFDASDMAANLGGVIYGNFLMIEF